MSDFYDTPTHPKARKAHRCGPCSYPIAIGEAHVCQTGFYEGHAFRSRYHQECWDALSDDGFFEYCPGDLPPPDRLLKVTP